MSDDPRDILDTIAKRADGDDVPRLARYKQLGNAVAVPVFEWVARRLASIEGGSS